MLDRISDIDDTGLTAWQQIDSRHEVFVGHFPGFPLWPGVLLIEGMAQSVAAYFIHLHGELAVDEVPVLGMVDCRLLAPVLPGAGITYRVETIRCIASTGMFKVHASDAGRSCARGRISVAIRKKAFIVSGEGLRDR
ncbi:MAG: hypothetical protein JST22_05400 [Bacteroidetes bacterium]|nr:hypothetical protein [Bacteroidota bacterium]